MQSVLGVQSRTYVVDSTGFFFFEDVDSIIKPLSQELCFGMFCVVLGYEVLRAPGGRFLGGILLAGGNLGGFSRGLWGVGLSDFGFTLP